MVVENPKVINSQKYKAVLLLGPPGSGKGTLGKSLGLAGNHVHLSSGDIFRGLDPDSSVGKVYQTYASKGNLVPDEVTIAVWHQYVEGLISTGRYQQSKQLLLLDGIPRTMAQAKILDDYIDVVKVIVLQMPSIDGLIERMRKRALIEKRQDDANEEVLLHRMQVYEKETMAIIEHYPKEKIAYFNANQTPLEVLRDVLVELTNVLVVKSK